MRIPRTLAAAALASCLLSVGGVVGPAWAPHVAQLQVTPTQVRPGESVTVYGPRGYGRTNEIEVRWGSPTGPVLGTFRPNEESYAQFGPGEVTIPADAQAGAHSLWATQELTPGETYIRGVPSQAVVEVVGIGGAPVLSQAPLPAPGQEERIGVEREEGADAGRLAVIAFGVGGIALFVGGAGAVAMSRRSPATRTAETAGGK